MSDPLELAWAAGFFDGEGSTSVVYSYYTRLASIRTNLAQKELEPLRRFHAAVEVGRIGGPWTFKTGSSYHVYNAGGKDSETLFALLWPYLSGPKKDQARSVFTRANKERASRNDSLHLYVIPG